MPKVLLIAYIVAMAGACQAPVVETVNNPCADFQDSAGNPMTMSAAFVQAKSDFRPFQEKTKFDLLDSQSWKPALADWARTPHGQAMLVLCGGPEKLPIGYQFTTNKEGKLVAFFDPDIGLTGFPKDAEQESGSAEPLMIQQTNYLGENAAFRIFNWPEDSKNKNDFFSECQIKEGQSGIELYSGQKWTPSHGVEKIR